MKKHTQNFEHFCKCIDNTVEQWHRADRITELERRERIQQTLYGVAHAALYVLNGDEYHDIVEYIHSKGFNH